MEEVENNIWKDKKAVRKAKHKMDTKIAHTAGFKNAKEHNKFLQEHEAEHWGEKK